MSQRKVFIEYKNNFTFQTVIRLTTGKTVTQENYPLLNRKGFFVYKYNVLLVCTTCFTYI